ncbi:hypothetical protein TTHERM_01222570 (macronuclear) [Tetrahymena thermophila SB210]|uniref:Uncharacterized protein n=1 Tax=Tetrahymena thermophila (strain SB210) TaxID=312017 RepID=Q24GS3_TETTS|nr:hypothetical protein TTHERM_01222570 [Tetrahymena thermophila SB210]EAS06987.1 hypothetical protein TTHERM_01222570 [Tetrahymena thermophila SB210]|eukprot:XP_001027229.1 hypothetical protein TTHERM_01222570 [Tetrahymena thermophila SB210]
MNSQLNTDKDSVYHFLKKLNGDVQQTINEMRSDFDKNPSSQNIKDRFLKWKTKYSEIVNNSLKEHIFTNETDIANFDFKDFLNKITEDYQNENEFLDLLKNLNQEIESLKEFIKSHLVKDPSIYFVKEI